MTEGMTDEKQTALSRGERVRDGGQGKKERLPAGRQRAFAARDHVAAGVFLHARPLEEKGGK
jgi:hypothetical protein